MKRLLAALILVTLSWSCADSPGPTLPSPPAPTPTPTPTPTPVGPPLTVSGIVRDRTSRRLLEGVKMDAVFLGDRMSTGPGFHVVTDASGVYTISSFPADAVNVRVILSDSRYTVRLGLYPLLPGETRIDFETDLRKIYTLSGVAFEATPDGPMPVEGALIEAFACELNCAAYMWSTSTTDRNGRYSIPDMWAGIETGLWITRAGYIVDEPRPAVPCDLCDRLITSNVDTQLDILLVRR